MLCCFDILLSRYSLPCFHKLFIFVFQLKNRGKDGQKVTLFFFLLEIIKLYIYNKYALHTQYSTCIYYNYTPCLIYTLCFFPANLKGQRLRRLNEAEVKAGIQDIIGGGGPGGDTHLEFLCRVLRTIENLYAEDSRLRRIFLGRCGEHL